MEQNKIQVFKSKSTYKADKERVEVIKECPACTGPMRLSEETGQMICDYCGTKITLPGVNRPAPEPTVSPAPIAKEEVFDPFDESRLWIATGKERVYLVTKMINRHGLVAGATGTGKTVTTKVLAEALSSIGVPVFMSDIKGDVSGLCKAGEPNSKVEERVQSMGIPNFSYSAYPTRFFDIFGRNGVPVRTTISGMGPLLISRILGLNETQTGILHIVFKIADDSGMLLLDLKDLRSMVQFVGENSREFTLQYGNITTQSIGAIQRSILTLTSSGGEEFFGEPALDIRDWLACDSNGRGYINIMDCVTLFQSPLLYSTFLLWMLSELYEVLPEVGDPEKPKMVFFFDEAHLLFTDAPKALLQKIEQVVRLIRSKGVGIFFITHSPADIPDVVMSQLGNKIQHALRAYTPKEQKGVRAAAASYRPNPEFNSETVLGELSTGEALISVLDEKGAPRIVQRAFLLPPHSYMGVAEPHLIAELTRNSLLYSKYGQAIDRESAFEILQRQKQQQQSLLAQQQQLKQQATQAKAKPAPRGSSPVDKVVNSAMSQVGRDVGRSLARGLLGNIIKK